MTEVPQTNREGMEMGRFAERCWPPVDDACLAFMQWSARLFATVSAFAIAVAFAVTILVGLPWLFVTFPLSLVAFAAIVAGVFFRGVAVRRRRALARDGEIDGSGI